MRLKPAPSSRTFSFDDFLTRSGTEGCSGSQECEGFSLCPPKGFLLTRPSSSAAWTRLSLVLASLAASAGLPLILLSSSRSVLVVAVMSLSALPAFAVARLLPWHYYAYGFLATIWFPIDTLVPGILSIRSTDVLLMGLAPLLLVFAHRRAAPRRRGYLLALPLLLYSLGGGYALVTGKSPDRLDSLLLFIQACLRGPALWLLFASCLWPSARAEGSLLAAVVGGAVLVLLLILLSLTPAYVQTSELYAVRLGNVYRLGRLELNFHPNSVGTYLATLIPCAFVLQSSASTRARRVMSSAALVLCSVGLAATGSRGGILAGLAGTGAVLLVPTQRHFKESHSSRLGVLIATTAGSLLILPRLLPEATASVLGRLTSLLQLTADSSLISRAFLWNVGVQDILRRPTGYGFVRFLPSLPEYPHSQYILVALGTGVIGLVGYVTFCLGLLFMSARGATALDHPSAASCRSGVGAISAFLIAAVADNVALTPFVQSASWALFGVVCAAYLNGENTRAT
jgi:hypothetical protein